MSKTKSNIHSILCDYEFLYEYRRKLSFFNDFEKKGIKKIKGEDDKDVVEPITQK